VNRKMVAIPGRFHGMIQGWKCSECGWEYPVQGFTATGEVVGITGNRTEEHAAAQKKFKQHTCKPTEDLKAANHNV